MSKRHPDCEKDPSECRVAERSRGTTMMGWAPVYDGNGRLTNSDPNTTRCRRDCSTCDRTWTVQTVNGVETVSDRL